MTTSGVTTFDLSLTDAVEEAFERAGAEIRSGYDLRTARRSLNLLLISWANRGINLWTVSTDSVTLTPGVYQYTLADPAVDLIEHVIRTGAGSITNQADLTLNRISVSTYATIPNKLSQGRPIQIYVDRQQNQIVMNLWPVPDSSTTYTLAFWYLRRMYDAGPIGTNTTDVPYRFLNALVSGLAYYIATKIPEGAPKIPLLKQQYDEAFLEAAEEDRTKAPVRFVPRIGFL